MIPVIILVGGLGTRLGKETHNIPKPLIEVSGKPFLIRILDRLATQNFREIFLCTGHMGHQFENKIGAKYLNLNINYSHEHNPLGTGGAILNCFKSYNIQEALVMNGDTYTQLDYKTMIDHWKIQKYDFVLSCTYVSNTSRYGTISLNSQGGILKFNEKDCGVSSGLINSGNYLINKSIFKHRSVCKFSWEQEILQPLSARFGVFRHEGQFIDIGIPKDLEFAREYFK